MSTETRNMRYRRDLTGQRFGRLRVIGFVPGSRRPWRCECECGKRTDATSSALVTGNTSSCGCLRVDKSTALHTKHGGKGTAEYRTWMQMRGRCASAGLPSYANYGGRGIRVCERWDDFAAFLADMGLRPSASHSIDRIDVNGNYEPSNCRWATRVVQNRNTRSTRLDEAKAARIRRMAAAGIRQKEIAESLGVSKSCVCHVVAGRTWSVDA